MIDDKCPVDIDKIIDCGMVSPWYLGMIDNKYVLMNSSYLLLDMSITGSGGWFNFVF
jgi:hypothetical protein